MSMIDDWNRFSNDVRGHIKESSKKYHLVDGVELANLLPWQWAIGDAIKYLIEVCKWINEGLEEFETTRRLIVENFWKSAHCIQIAATRCQALSGEIEKEQKNSCKNMLSWTEPLDEIVDAAVGGDQEG